MELYLDFIFDMFITKKLKNMKHKSLKMKMYQPAWGIDLYFSNNGSGINQITESDLVLVTQIHQSISRDLSNFIKFREDFA